MFNNQIQPTVIESNDEVSSHSDESSLIKKNFTVLSLTFILVYTSYNAVTNLQSSINIDKTTSLYSLGVISGCSILSYFFLTNPIIFVFGYKWTIFLAQIGFILFIAANIYPKAWLMFPGKHDFFHVFAYVCYSFGSVWFLSSWLLDSTKCIHCQFESE